MPICGTRSSTSKESWTMETLTRAVAGAFVACNSVINMCVGTQRLNMEGQGGVSLMRGG